MLCTAKFVEPSISYPLCRITSIPKIILNSCSLPQLPNLLAAFQGILPAQSDQVYLLSFDGGCWRAWGELRVGGLLATLLCKDIFLLIEFWMNTFSASIIWICKRLILLQAIFSVTLFWFLLGRHLISFHRLRNKKSFQAIARFLLLHSEQFPF